MSKAVLHEIVTRITDATQFSKVSAAIHIKNVVGSPISGQAQAWVIELDSKPNQPQQDIGSLLQEEPVRYAVVIGLRTVNDPTGEKAVSDLDELRHHVRQQLFDWRPSAEYDTFCLAGAELIYSEAAALYWAERFEIKHFISQGELL